jgi:hypothetical protein
MNGLLRRLAARATGTSVAVRSNARLGVGALGFTPSQGATGAESSLTFEAREADPSYDRGRAPGVAATSQHPPTPPIERAAWPGLSGPSPIGEARTDDDVLRQPASAPPPLVDEVVEARRVPSATDVPFVTRDSVAPRAVDVPDAASGVRVVREPPLLVSLTGVTREGTDPPSPRPASRSAEGPAPALGRADDTDVHIHIGSIEVTAAHEPATPRRRPVSAPPPMSLDTYLSKRGRG